MSDLDSMREAIRAVAAVPAQLASFGVERVTERDGLWSERLSISGSGRASLSSNRSFGDASGEEIGTFEADLPRERVSALVQSVEAVLGGGPPPNLSPGDVRLTITVVAAGVRWDQVVGGDPPALAPYQPLLRTLDALAVEVRARPVRTLALSVQLGAPVRAGAQELPVTLNFRNDGTAGYWVRNPSAGLPDEPTEHVRLWYALRPREEPGVSPLPVEPLWAPLQPVAVAERPLIWMAAASTDARQFRAAIEVDPGAYFLRASFASYAGGDTVAGQAHLRGCAFSQELEFEVSS